MKLRFSRLILCLTLLIAPDTRVWSAAFPGDGPSGIRFFKGSWKDVLAEAKRQNKPVFLDVYTTWCPPCKRMAREAFPNPAIGAKFNVHFINYQIDAEKGEGFTLAKQYNVTSYPTALYIAPNGDLLNKLVGYGGIKGMLAQADQMLAMPRIRETIIKGDKDYVDGRRDPTFLKKYVLARQVANQSTSDALDAYLDALPEAERPADDTRALVAGAIQSANTKAFDYLLKNRPSPLSSDPAQQALASIVYNALYRVLANDFKQACAASDEALLEKFIINSERNAASGNPFVIHKDVQKQEAANDYRLTFYKQTANFAKYRAIAEPIAQQLMSQSVTDLHKKDSSLAVQIKPMMAFVPDSLKKQLTSTPESERQTQHIASWKVAYTLSEIADTYRQLGSTSTDWTLALAWIARSIDLYRTHRYLNGYALLLKKIGRTDDAITAQEEAIREAGKADWNTRRYEKELAEMQRQ
ncbi:thioredoxin fold domain-containing protein [Spirosoma agri]|uniref:Thioredoxin fold domain-containing protein n=1 Tax=Spirosoma agri TaxID=1987381 RepID=A0A6M0IG73_9BACT|nr:thioredoxin fold domain-containing protein [Spirosoma agri]NEU66023.1 thioredoxin fold domain-containing protein [Spirosoma agri]